MKLLVTEIHNHNEPHNARIVFAADRRITRNGHYANAQKKIFEIPRLYAGIGYFGLAEIESGASARPMHEWVGQHLRQNTIVFTLAEFSNALADHLNLTIPKQHRQHIPSGFHIAGVDDSARIEFWFVRNVKDDRTTCTGTYAAREDFQSRDMAILQPGQNQIYRNGDYCPCPSLGNIDSAVMPLLNRTDFSPVRAEGEYAWWVRFKMEIIAYVYKKYCNRPIVGRPIDVFCINATNSRRQREHV